MKGYSWRRNLEEVFGLDLRAMAFLRIAFACIILTDLIQRAFHMNRDYTDHGVLPRSLLLTYPIHPLSIHLITGSLAGQIFLFIVAGIFALGLLVGYQTTLCSIISWFLLVSLQDRNFIIYTGGDLYLKLVLFWGMFLPWGRRYSIDSLGGDSEKNNTFSSLATFGFILQVCLVYFFAGTLKSGYPHWKDGTHLYYILNFEENTKPFSQLMLHYPRFLSVLSNCVPYFEKYVSLLLIFPFFTPYFRLLGIVLIMLFHIGILTTLELGLFSLICIAAVMGFLPKEFWDILTSLFSSLIKNPKNNVVPKSTINPVEITSSLNTLPRHDPIKKIRSLLLVVFLTASLIDIIFINVSTLPHSQIKIPGVFQKFGKLLHLYQNWNMYCRGKLLDSGWYVIEGTLNNGQEVNALTGDPVDFNRPLIVYKTYPGERDRKLLNYLRSKNGRPVRIYYARFLCWDWDTSHKDNEQMKRVQVFYMKQVMLLNNLRTSPQKIPLLNDACP